MKPPDQNWWKEERVKCIGCSTETYASDYEDVRHRLDSPWAPSRIIATEMMGVRVECKQLQCLNCGAINWLLPPADRKDLHMDVAKFLDDVMAAMPDRMKIYSLLKKQTP